MTMTDSEHKFFAVKALTSEFQRELAEQLAEHQLQSIDISYVPKCQDIGYATIDDSCRSINLTELASTVHEMKKKVDVLAEHFAFLFTPFDKPEQN